MLNRRTFLAGLPAAAAALPSKHAAPQVSIESPRAAGPDIRLSDFQQHGRSVWQAFIYALDACRGKRAAQLILPPGKYVFDDPAILQRPAHIELNDLSDLIIDGQGSELVFHHIRRGFVFRNCRRLVLRNFSVDWDINLVSPGVVTAEPGGRKAIRIPGDYPVGDKTPIGAVTEYDLDKLEWKLKAAEIYYPKNVRLLRPQVMYSEDFDRGGRPPGLQPGMTVVVRHYVYNAHGFDFGRAANSDLAFEDVAIYRCPGHAWVGYGCERGFRLSRCRIMRRPGKKDLVTATADGAHFGLTRGDILVENCDFSFQGDDSINIHGAWLRVAAMPSRREVTLTSRWLMPELAEPGAVLRFHRRPNLAEYGEATVVKAGTAPGQKGLLVTFDRDLPSGVAEQDYVSNLTRSSSGFVIRNNYFHHHRARGMLLQACDGLVENNRIANVQAAAIQITTDADYWQEGYGCRNLTVRRNHIERCNYAMWERGEKGRHMACINVVVDLGSSLGDYPVHRDITIEENTIRDTPGLAILIASARGVRVKNNRVVDANTEPFQNTGAAIGAKAQGAIMVTHASDVEVSGNRIEGARSSEHGVWVDKATTNKIVVRRNKHA